MGTTLTLVAFTPAGLIAAHIGDSRIYLVTQAKQQYWRTTDHSYVAELVKAGIITEAEARTHSMRNRISRAIVGDADRKTDQPDIVEVTNLQRGDLVLLCTDGVLEAFDDEQLLRLLTTERRTVEEKIEAIRKGCQVASHDNNTALLIEISDNISKEDKLTRRPFPWQSSAMGGAKPKGVQPGPIRKTETRPRLRGDLRPKSHYNKALWMLLIVLLVALLTFGLLNWDNKLKTKTQKSKTPAIEKSKPTGSRHGNKTNRATPNRRDKQTPTLAIDTIQQTEPSNHAQ
jgi:hypothetical protein